MNNYITGKTIKDFRKKQNITQEELADRIGVSAKTISKWETGKGYPSISLIEPLAKTLSISTSELLSGVIVTNNNTHANVLNSSFYVCPICGNIIVSVGDAFISCHGINLVKEEARTTVVNYEFVEDEIYLNLNSPMSKDDYITFACAISYEGFELKRLYPEQEPFVRFKRSGVVKIYYYSKREGLLSVNVKSHHK